MTEPTSADPITIRFTDRAYEQMRGHLLKDELEEACFSFAHVVKSPGRRIFLVDRVLTLDPACYLRRSRTVVVVDARAKNALYNRFVACPYTGLINSHSHPFEKGEVRFSDVDDRDDLREMAWQYDQLPLGKRALGQRAEVQVLSMVFGQYSLDARGYEPGRPPALPAIEQVQVVGKSFRVLIPTGAADRPSLSATALETYDRQILAFGADGQSALSSLRVGLVGGGGIGSILSEGLGRLGVGSLTLIDPDSLNISNLNRFQGGRPTDIGQPKVDVLADRLGTIVPEMTVVPIAAPLTAPEALAALKGCDILIGAVDNHLARFVLNRLSVQYLIPYLDAASAITRHVSENQMELLARLGVVVPGTTACLDCSRITYYDYQALVPHLYDLETRQQLAAAGYVQDHSEIAAPAVMPLNMQAAAMVLIELLNLVTGFHPLARYVRIDWLRPNGEELRADGANFPEGPADDCLGCAALLGVGDSEPLPAVNIAPLAAHPDKI